MNQKKRLLLYPISFGLLLFALPVDSSSQTSESEKRDRFEFAQTYLGLDLFYISAPEKSYPLTPQKNKNNAYSLIPKLSVGGPHFWGHAEFFVNISFPGLTNSDEISLNPGTETGFRIYPWSLYWQNITPFAGFTWSMFSYEQSTSNFSGPSIQRSTTYLQSGISWRNRSHLVQTGIHYQLVSSFDYPLSRSEFSEVRLSPWQGWISYK